MLFMQLFDQLKGVTERFFKALIRSAELSVGDGLPVLVALPVGDKGHLTRFMIVDPDFLRDEAWLLTQGVGPELVIHLNEPLTMLWGHLEDQKLNRVLHRGVTAF